MHIIDAWCSDGSEIALTRQQGGILFWTNQRICLPFGAKANHNAYIFTTFGLDTYFTHKYTVANLNPLRGPGFCIFGHISTQSYNIQHFLKKLPLGFVFHSLVVKLLAFINL